MATFLGRFRHHDAGPKHQAMRRIADTRNEEIERELEPDADCRCPSDGKPIEDEDPESTGIKAFKKASDAMHHIGSRKPSTADAAAADTSKLSPIQRFAEASRARWGMR